MVSNEKSTVTSSIVTLTVDVVPSIVTEPVNVTVKAPAKGTFKVTASGNPALKYQWMKSVNGGQFGKITGATGSSYTTPATTIAMSGNQYDCVVTNTVGSATSSAASLTVYPRS